MQNKMIKAQRQTLEYNLIYKHYLPSVPVLKQFR